MVFLEPDMEATKATFFGPELLFRLQHLAWGQLEANRVAGAQI